MAGTKEGGRKAAATNKKLYGDGKDGRPNFYRMIGKKGGEVSRGGGFAADHDFAVEMGRKGGTAQRKRKAAGTE